MEEECGGFSFVLSAFLFVRSSPIYKGGRTNAQEQICSAFVVSVLIGHYRGFFRFILQENAHFKTLKYFFQNI